MLYRIVPLCWDPLHPTAIHRLLRHSGLLSQHPHGHHVMAVLLDQRGERASTYQPRSSDGRHRCVAVDQTQWSSAAGNLTMLMNVSSHFAVSHLAVSLYRDRDRVRVRVNYTTPRNGEVGNGEVACHRWWIPIGYSGLIRFQCCTTTKSDSLFTNYIYTGYPSSLKV